MGSRSFPLRFPALAPCLPVVLVLLLVPLFVQLLASGASALQISFETRDLPDVIAGEDLRELSLRLGPFDRAAGFGVSVLFSPELYTALQAPAPSADWDLLLIQPDPLLPDVGRYDLQAQVANPSVAAPFVLSFVWLGSGDPGPNPFEVFDPSFATVETGVTTSVAEPGAGVLWLALAPLLRRGRRS